MPTVRLLLAPEDIRSDDFVSIYSPMRNAVSELTEHAELAGLIAKKTPVPAGVPLRVMDCSLPFVVCAVIEPGGGEAGPVILDLREVQLCRLRSGFVNAIVSFESSDSEKEGESQNDGVPF